jgi:hypothetical protein
MEDAEQIATDPAQPHDADTNGCHQLLGRWQPATLGLSESG